VQLLSHYLPKIIEVVGVITGIISIRLNTQQRAAGWLVGILSISCYIFVFWDTLLYADMLLNMYYLLSGIYGWLRWTRHISSEKNLHVSYASRKELSILCSISILIGSFLGYSLSKTEAVLPYLNAFTAAFSLSAQWLMTQKRIECWIFWSIINLVNIFLYAHTGLYFTAVLFGIYVVLSGVGYVEWKREL
jgi:nicotinamide mononucleotide transporter